MCPRKEEKTGRGYKGVRSNKKISPWFDLEIAEPLLVLLSLDILLCFHVPVYQVEGPLERESANN